MFLYAFSPFSWLILHLFHLLITLRTCILSFIGNLIPQRLSDLPKDMEWKLRKFLRYVKLSEGFWDPCPPSGEDRSKAWSFSLTVCLALFPQKLKEIISSAPMTTEWKGCRLSCFRFLLLSCSVDILSWWTLSSVRPTFSKIV